VALVEARQAARFTARAKVLGLVLDKRATVTGIAIGGFRTVEVGVYRAAPAVPSG
jgi:hypothetical protein